MDKQWLYISRGNSGSAIRHSKYETIAKNSAELIMLPLYSGCNRHYRRMNDPPLFWRADFKPKLVKMYGATLGDGGKATKLRDLWCSFSWHFRRGVAALKWPLVDF